MFFGTVVTTSCLLLGYCSWNSVRSWADPRFDGDRQEFGTDRTAVWRYRLEASITRCRPLGRQPHGRPRRHYRAPPVKRSGEMPWPGHPDAVRPCRVRSGGARRHAPVPAGRPPAGRSPPATPTWPARRPDQPSCRRCRSAWDLLPSRNQSPVAPNSPPTPLLLHLR